LRGVQKRRCITAVLSMTWYYISPHTMYILLLLFHELKMKRRRNKKKKKEEEGRKKEEERRRKKKKSPSLFFPTFSSLFLRTFSFLVLCLLSIFTCLTVENLYNHCNMCLIQSSPL